MNPDFQDDHLPDSVELLRYTKKFDDALRQLYSTRSSKRLIIALLSNVSLWQTLEMEYSGVSPQTLERIRRQWNEASSSVKKILGTRSSSNILLETYAEKITKRAQELEQGFIDYYQNNTEKSPEKRRRKNR